MNERIAKIGGQYGSVYQSSRRGHSYWRACLWVCYRKEQVFGVLRVSRAVAERDLERLRFDYYVNNEVDRW